MQRLCAESKADACQLRQFGSDRQAFVTNLSNQHVAELPGIGFVDVFREQAWTTGQRRPGGVVAFHRAEIGRLHFQAAFVINLVGLDDAGIRIFQCPHHAGQNR